MKTTTLIATLSLLVGCVAAEDLSPEEIAQGEADISGFNASRYFQGVVEFNIAGDKIPSGMKLWHNGILIVKPGAESTATTSTLILTTSNNLPSSLGTRCYPAIEVKYGKVNNFSTGVQTVHVSNWIRHGWLPLVLLQLDAPLDIRPFGTVPAIATSEPIPGSGEAGQPLVCFGYDSFSNSQLKTANGHVRTDTSLGYLYEADPGSSLVDGDAGAMCTDGPVTRISGLAYKNNTSGKNEQVSLSQVREWISNQADVSRWFAATAFHERNTFISLANGQCADIPWGTPADSNVNQYGCHYGDNQAFYDFGWVFGAGPPTTVFVNVMTAKCLTANTASTGGLRQATCNFTDANQSWAYVTARAADGTSGALIKNPATGKCMRSATAPASGTQITLATCPATTTSVDKTFLWSAWNYQNACTP